MGTGYAVARILDVYPQLNSEGVEGVLAYGSFACVERRFVYVQIPKAACTAVKRLLREVVNASPLRLFGWSARETRRSMFIHDRDNVPIPPLTALDSALQRELLESPDVLRFTIVRNPYTRLVSAWRDKVVLCEPCVEDVYAAVRGEPPPLENKTILSFGEFVSYIERATYWDGHWGRQVDLCFPQALSFNHVRKG
jgi:hypothetical protein